MKLRLVVALGLALMGGGIVGKAVEAAPVTPPESTFFATVFVEEKATYNASSDGDLWPIAWSDDDYLYTANGDGKGFSLLSPWSDIVVNRITGHPAERNIIGVGLSRGDQVGQVWSDPKRYNRKPTGMVSVDGVLYLAVQDLNKEPHRAFDDAPAATILKSTDKGRTWTWDKSGPMFRDGVFTTIFFLDYGKDGADNTFDEYVYAYGLDGNWRDSFSNTAPDPTKLYLARIPKWGLQDVSTWEFYTGDLEGNASWSAPGDIGAKKPVLRDERRVYAYSYTARPNNMSVLSQGSVVYNKPLDRYIYTSWTEFTFEFYEAPTPWGPWRLFLSYDFGAYPWTEDSHGGYATVIPSKFISPDGREMWLNANTFAGRTVVNYGLSMRRLLVTPWRPTTPSNPKSDVNLAVAGRDVTPISRMRARGGSIWSLNDGDKSAAVDSFNLERKPLDWWGYTWSQSYHMNEVVYTAGSVIANMGGWFKDLRVQVRQNHRWIDVTNLSISPDYPFDPGAAGGTYRLRFDDTWGDGVRIIGTPGGGSTFTSIAELEVYYVERE